MFEGLKKKFSGFIDALSKKEEKGEKDSAGGKLPDAGAAAAEGRVPPVYASSHEDRGQAGGGSRELMEERSDRVERRGAGETSKHGTERDEGAHDTVPEGQKSRDSGAASRGESSSGTAGRLHASRDRAAAGTEPHLHDQKATLGTRLKGMVFKEVRVSQDDINPFLEQLKLALLQSDVNYEVAEKIADKLRVDLTGRPISAKDLSGGITAIIRESVLSVLQSGSSINLIEMARSRRATSGEPFKILFLGPNGAGKTTTMAKIARMFMDNGMTCVLSASDTFRAAAIEQTVYHAGKLGVHVIKGVYGADPASVAFDAIAYAKAHGIDAVLIDSAGRQETNRSLMEEIKKMARIAKPDVKLFVGESIAGNALLGQVKEFNQAVRLDGIILTKLDTDAKGGNTLSILSETEVPVLFFTTGEGYHDITAYSPGLIINSLVPDN